MSTKLAIASTWITSPWIIEPRLWVIQRLSGWRPSSKDLKEAVNNVGEKVDLVAKGLQPLDNLNDLADNIQKINPKTDQDARQQTADALVSIGIVLADMNKTNREVAERLGARIEALEKATTRATEMQALAYRQRKYRTRHGRVLMKRTVKAKDTKRQQEGSDD